MTNNVEFLQIILTDASKLAKEKEPAKNISFFKNKEETISQLFFRKIIRFFIATGYSRLKYLLTRYLLVRVIVRDDLKSKIYGVYKSTNDRIMIHYPDRFVSKEYYLSVLLHEIGHAIGSNKRLNRDYFRTSQDLSTACYYEEEVIAELFSMLIMHEYNLDNPLIVSENTNYIARQIKNIESLSINNKKVIDEVLKSYHYFKEGKFFRMKNINTSKFMEELSNACRL